jgi:hypothetical protein
LRYADFLGKRAHAARHPDRFLEARIPHCWL